MFRDRTRDSVRVRVEEVWPMVPMSWIGEGGDMWHIERADDGCTAKALVV